VLDAPAAAGAQQRRQREQLAAARVGEPERAREASIEAAGRASVGGDPGQHDHRGDDRRRAAEHHAHADLPRAEGEQGERSERHRVGRGRAREVRPEQLRLAAVGVHALA
jgi:hypothetical protein